MEGRREPFDVTARTPVGDVWVFPQPVGEFLRLESEKSRIPHLEHV